MSNQIMAGKKIKAMFKFYSPGLCFTILLQWHFAAKCEFLIHSLQMYFLSEPESPCKLTEIIDHSFLFLWSHWLHQFMLLSAGEWKIQTIDELAIVDMTANVEMPIHICVQTLERRAPKLSTSSSCLAHRPIFRWMAPIDQDLHTMILLLSQH